MHVGLAIVKQEVDIDDTKIKLELDNELSDNSTVQISWAAETLKMIGGDDSQRLTMPYSDPSQDKTMSIVRKGSSSSQQQAPRNSIPNPFECRICHFLFDKHLDISSHMVDHQINRHFCSFGCGEWLDSLEKILEHEYRHHSRPGLKLCCRICDFVAKDADNLATHMENHVYVYRFVCAICRQHFESIELIERHRNISSILCGQVKYIDGPSTKAELVAIGTRPVSVSGQVLCDVQIKSEPLEVEEEMAPMPVEIVKAEPQEPEEVQKVSVKKDPDSVEQTINSFDGFWSSIPNPLRSKLRLPAVKTSNAQMKLKSVVNEIHSSDGNQSIISQLPSDKTRILQKKPPKTAANILKVLPSNCMVIKLPPNTKIIKMVGQAPASALNKSNIYVPNVSEKSTSSAIAIPQSITISQIKPEEANQILPVGSASSLLPQTHNRNTSLLHDAFNKAESHPESMKIISEFRNQIRSIEKTLPLPGTVLQSTKTTRNYPATFSKLATSVNSPKPIELFLSPLSLTVVRELRITYPLYGFMWTCPLCHRSYEQNYAIRMHLISNHNLSQDQLNYLKVMLMPYKLLSQDNLPLESEQQVPKFHSKGKLANVASLLLDATAPTPTTPLIVDAKNNLTPTKAKPDRSFQNEGRNKKNKTKFSKYECTECSKTFTTFGALRIHKTIHTGELPYKCDYCEKRFRTPGQVRVHHRRHTGEKPFKCKVCSLDFTHRETLISHLSRHIGMKRYKCYGCDKYFVVVSGLRAHRRLRPDTCGKVKFTARAHGPRVRVVRGEVVFEPHPEHNGYLRSEDPLNILSERAQTSDLSTATLTEGLN